MDCQVALEILLREQEHGKRSRIADDIINFVDKLKSKYDPENSSKLRGHE